MTAVVNPTVPLSNGIGSFPNLGREEKRPADNPWDVLCINTSWNYAQDTYTYYSSPYAPRYENPLLQLPITVGTDGRIRVAEQSIPRPATGTMWPRGTGWSGPG